MSMIIPTVTEQTPRGERLVDLYSRLLGSRIIFLGTEINETSANLVIAQLLHLDAEDIGKDIFLYINSPSGRTAWCRRSRTDRSCRRPAS